MFPVLKKTTLVASAMVMTLGMAANAFAAGATKLEGPVRTSPSPSQAAATSFQVPFSQVCYTGFNKGPKVMQNPTMIDYYICYSDVISCPAFYDTKTKTWADVKPVVIVKKIGGNPEGGQANRFQIQYKCDYSPAYVPVE